MGVRPAADMAAAVKKLDLPSVMQANELSAVETGAPDSNRYGLDEETYAWMRQGVNALRKQAASKMKKQLTDEYLNSLPLTFGDIMLTPDQLQNMFQQHGINVPQRQKRNTINFNNYPGNKWSFPIIYVIDPVLEAANEYKTLIQDSLAEWERQTCVLFERHDVSEILTRQHLRFTNESSGCFAYVGRVSETVLVPQVVNLETPSCFGLWGTTLHEVGHALGLWHQQSRPDRDTYVKILSENIIPEYIHNFDKKTTDTANTYNVPYDYGSVMHYGPTGFAIQDGLYSIEPVDSTQITVMGQRTELSFFDHMVINAAYCNTVCPTKLPCQNGGYTDPKNCQACRCPDGWGGTLCDQVHQGSAGCSPMSGVIDVQHTNMTNTIQYVQSPNFINPDPQYRYNGPYAMGSSCSWILQAPANCVINFWFKWVGTPSLTSGSCLHWVEVQYKTSHVIRGQRFCGYRSYNFTSQNPLTSDSNKVFVIFSAPVFESLNPLGDHYFQGFRMFYEQGVCYTQVTAGATTITPITTSTTSAGPTAVQPITTSSSVTLPAGPTTVQPITTSSSVTLPAGPTTVQPITTSSRVSIPDNQAWKTRSSAVSVLLAIASFVYVLVY